MAANYLMKIKPSLDGGDAAKMERDLNSRFTRVAKRFGQGLKKAGSMLRFGGMAGAIGAVLGAILTPLEEIDTALNNILAKGDNIQTKAGQYNTTAARYAKLQGAARSADIEEHSIDMMLDRFQDMLGRAKRGEDNILGNYKDETDTVVAFYKAVKNLQNVEDKDKRASMTSEIFGQKAVGKLAEFLDTDLDRRIRLLFKGTSNRAINASTKKLADLEGEQAILTVKRELRDMLDKAKIVNSEIIGEQDKLARARLARQNAQLATYKEVAKMSEVMEEMKNMLVNLTTKVFPVIETSLNGLKMLPQAVEDTKYVIERIGGKIDKLMDKLPSWLGGGSSRKNSGGGRGR